MLDSQATSIPVEPMPLRISLELQIFFNFVNNISGRRCGSVGGDIVCERQAPIGLEAAGATPVGNEVLGRPSPKAAATAV